MIQCSHCHKQYIGETKRRLKHPRPVDKQTNSSMSTTVSEMILCISRNATNMQLISLELAIVQCRYKEQETGQNLEQSWPE